MCLYVGEKSSVPTEEQVQTDPPLTDCGLQGPVQDLADPGQSDGSGVGPTCCPVRDMDRKHSWTRRGPSWTSSVRTDGQHLHGWKCSWTHWDETNTEEFPTIHRVPPVQSVCLMASTISVYSLTQRVCSTTVLAKNEGCFWILSVVNLQQNHTSVLCSPHLPPFRFRVFLMPEYVNDCTDVDRDVDSKVVYRH